MEKKTKNKLILMNLTAVLTALVFVLTAYLHIPSFNGYVHVGDAVIYLAASMLPAPYALFVGISGAVLADTLTGYAVWAPASAIIKGLTVLFFTRRQEKIINRRNALATVFSALLCVFGYYIYEVMLTGSFAAPVPGIYGNVAQSAASALLFFAAGALLDSGRVKGALDALR